MLPRVSQVTAEQTVSIEHWPIAICAATTKKSKMYIKIKTAKSLLLSLQLAASCKVSKRLFNSERQS